jgi:ATP-dependent protease HslVU (ClpYQ) peptidase subunit
MTCIAAIVDKEGLVTMGADSAGTGGTSLTLRKDTKVFTKGKFVFGFAGSYRMGQLLQYKFNIPDHDPRVDVDTYLRTDFIDGIRYMLSNGGFLKKVHEVESSDGGIFMFGYEGRIFTVYSDFQVAESLVSYYAIGCGDDIALGALHATEGLNKTPVERITLALQAAELYSSGVRGPFTFAQMKKSAEISSKSSEESSTNNNTASSEI